MITQTYRRTETLSWKDCFRYITAGSTIIFSSLCPQQQKPLAQTLLFGVAALHTDLNLSTMERSEKRSSVDETLKSREQGEEESEEVLAEGEEVQEELEISENEDEELGSTPLITACRKGMTEVREFRSGFGHIDVILLGRSNRVLLTGKFQQVSMFVRGSLVSFLSITITYEIIMTYILLFA